MEEEDVRGGGIADSWREWRRWKVEVLQATVLTLNATSYMENRCTSLINTRSLVPGDCLMFLYTHNEKHANIQLGTLAACKVS